jgi:hypothetical protein
MNIDEKDYGPGWIKQAFRPEKPMSSLGENVARLLNVLYQGIYHIDSECKKVDWSNDHHIEIVLRGCWATYDFDNLTRLVFLAHDYALRVQMEARANGYIRLMFHQRQREGHYAQRHPTIEFALYGWRANHEDQVTEIKEEVLR